jgi:hypothetical protein
MRLSGHEKLPFGLSPRPPNDWSKQAPLFAHHGHGGRANTFHFTRSLSRRSCHVVNHRSTNEALAGMHATIILSPDNARMQQTVFKFDAQAQNETTQTETRPAAGPNEQQNGKTCGEKRRER